MLKCSLVSSWLESGVGRLGWEGVQGLGHRGLRCQDSKLGLYPVGSGHRERFWTREASSRAAF